MCTCGVERLYRVDIGCSLIQVVICGSNELSAGSPASSERPAGAFPSGSSNWVEAQPHSPRRNRTFVSALSERRPSIGRPGCRTRGTDETIRTPSARFGSSLLSHEHIGVLIKSRWQDSNPRSPGPRPGAMTDFATPCKICVPKVARPGFEPGIRRSKRLVISNFTNRPCCLEG